MSAGFVVSDKVRRAIFIELMAGESEIERIVKKHRLLKGPAERAMAGLAEHDLVARVGKEGWKLTSSGEDTAAELKRNDMLR